MTPALQIKNLSKKFGKRLVLDNISFDVMPGEICGFIGPNGAGKSTTIKIIMGFLFPNSGDVIVNGYNIRTHYEEAMGSLGGIIENPEMYVDLSARLNLEMYGRLHGNVDKGRINEVAEMVGMQEHLNEQIKHYSLGMKQRIGIAQALLHKPKLLILDEPTNGLDPVGIAQLRTILKYIAKEENVAVLISSHQLMEIQQICDKAAIIDKGRIIGIKTMEELLNYKYHGKTYRLKVSNINYAKLVLDEYFSDARFVEVENDYIIIELFTDTIEQINKRFVLSDVLVSEIQPIVTTLEDAYIDITKGGITIA